MGEVKGLFFSLVLSVFGREEGELRVCVLTKEFTQFTEIRP